MSMEVNKVLQMVYEKTEARVAYLREWVSKGLAMDYAEYKSVCGEIKGLTEACRSINETYIETVEGENDE